jgi:SAM-dependent methyltransferase
MTAPISAQTWFRSPENEPEMESDHIHLWQRMIEKLGDADLSQASVMDFGCNQGGFLRLLYQQRPFALGVGIDKATASLKIARQKVTTEPIRFYPPDANEPWGQSYDYVFSQEVLYLLPDLREHARQIYGVLKKGCAYFAAVGCHTGNPLWSDWKRTIIESSHAETFDYAPDDYASAFFKAGFEVRVQKFMIDDFIRLKPDDPYFPRVADALSYNTEHKLLFKCIKK